MVCKTALSARSEMTSGHKSRRSVAADADRDIFIPLGTVEAAASLGSKEDCVKLVQDQYITKFLENLGVQSTLRDARKEVEASAPLRDCHIQAAWTDSSAIARNLRISQPPIVIGQQVAAQAPENRMAQDMARADSTAQEATGALKSVSAIARGAEDSLNAAAARNGERLMSFEKMCVKDPDIPTAATVHGWLGLAANGSGLAAAGALPRQAAHQRSYSKFTNESSASYDLLRSFDEAHSQGADAALVHEFERFRIGRGISPETTRNSTSLGEAATEHVLADLKQKFILPFACEQRGAVVPWQVLEQEEPEEMEVPKDFAAEVRQPIVATLQHIHRESSTFVQNRLPLHLLLPRQDAAFLAVMTTSLVSEDIAKLIGLLAHFIYWTIFSHLHDPERRLDDRSKHSLLVGIHDAWCKHRDSIHSSILGSSSLVPCALLLVLKRGVERVFAAQYPRCYEKHDLARRLVDKINVNCMSLFDPDCMFGHFPSLDSLPEAARLWRRHSQALAACGMSATKRSKVLLVRTTPLLQMALDGGAAAPSDARTRALLRKSASDAMLRPRSASLSRSCDSSSAGPVAAKACSRPPSGQPRALRHETRERNDVRPRSGVMRAGPTAAAASTPESSQRTDNRGHHRPLSSSSARRAEGQPLHGLPTSFSEKQIESGPRLRPRSSSRPPPIDESRRVALLCLAQRRLGRDRSVGHAVDV